MSVARYRELLPAFGRVDAPGADHHPIAGRSLVRADRAESAGWSAGHPAELWGPTPAPWVLEWSR